MYVSLKSMYLIHSFLAFGAIEEYARLIAIKSAGFKILGKEVMAATCKCSGFFWLNRLTSWASTAGVLANAVSFNELACNSLLAETLAFLLPSAMIDGFFGKPLMPNMRIIDPRISLFSVL